VPHHPDPRSAVELTADLGARYPGELRRLRVAAAADQHVHEVDGGRAHLHDALVVVRLRLGEVVADEHLAALADLNAPHAPGRLSPAAG
jgi:hypothetical protein